jgi:hypothetical protein
MHTLNRPTRRDWLAGLAAGASLGFVLLGVGARAGMRLFALASAQAPLFTIEGSIAVSVLGALTGALVATVFRRTAGCAAHSSGCCPDHNAAHAARGYRASMKGNTVLARIGVVPIS